MRQRKRTKMVLPHSSPNPLPPLPIPGTRRRVYLSALAIVLLVFTITHELLDDSLIVLPVSEERNDRGVLTVVSAYERPVVLVTLWGYLSDTGCKHDVTQEQLNEDAMFKVTILSQEEDVHSDGASVVQIGEAERVPNNDNNGTETELWKTHFRLNINSPSLEHVNNKPICYRVDYRVEYIDLQSSLQDFPTNQCSFRGIPQYHRSWQINEFVTTHTSKLYQGEWLIRNNSTNAWEWIGSMTASQQSNCPSWKQQRPYSLVIIGDSQPSYTCHHLLNGLVSTTTANTNVRCVTIKRTLQNTTTFQMYSSELQSSNEDFVIFNPSGLWETAYGTLEEFRTNFARLLEFIPTKKDGDATKRKKQRQYFFMAPTTAVHPIHYSNLYQDDKKWSMTQTRVREINSISREVLSKRAKLLESKSHDVVVSMLPVPWDDISLSRKDDPMNPTDMRHFGNFTNEMLLSAMLCKLDEIWEKDGQR